MDGDKLTEGTAHRDAVRGSLVGGAAGDALGYVVEFMRRGEILDRFGCDGITSYELGDGVARISDDTQMTLFTATGIIHGETRAMLHGIRGPVESCVHLHYLDWLSTQTDAEPSKVSWLLEVPELYHRRAPGGTCLSALASGEMGTVEHPLNNSKGCGGIMRVAPVGCFGRWSGYGFEEGKDVGAREVAAVNGAAVAAITHGHELGWLPAAVVSCMIHDLIYEGAASEDLAEVARAAESVVRRTNPHARHMDDLEGLMSRAVECAKNASSDAENIRSLGEGWVAEETLAIALYCCLRHEGDLSGAIRSAVNHDGDSDSTGAVAGNIMGAIVGYEAIPSMWKDDLEIHDVILDVADDLDLGCEGAMKIGGERSGEWNRRYRS